MTQWIFFLPSTPGASKNSKAHFRGSRGESSRRTFSNHSWYRGSGLGWDKGEKAERAEQTKLKGLFYIKQANRRSNTRKARERQKRRYMWGCAADTAVQWETGRKHRNWRLCVGEGVGRGEGEAKRGAGVSNQAHRQGGKHTGELHQLIRTLPTRAVGLQRKKHWVSVFFLPHCQEV